MAGRARGSAARVRGWLLALLLGGAAPAGAQAPAGELGRVEQLLLDQVSPIAAGEDALELRFRALTRSGASVAGLRAQDVELWEDERRVAPERIALAALEDAGEGLALALVLDASATMRGEFARVAAAARRCLELLRPQDRVVLLSIARDVRVHAGFADARAQAFAALDALAVEPERAQHTLLFDGVREAAALLRAQSAPRRALIVLFADGEDDGSRLTLEQAAAAARGAPEELPIPVHAVGYAGSRGGRDLGVLQELAARSGGELLQDSLGAPLGEFLARALAQLRASYVLRLRSAFDGAPHRLRLAVQERTAARSALYPPARAARWPWLLGGALLLLLLGGGGVGLALLGRRGVGRGVGRLAVVGGPLQSAVFELRPGRNRIGALADNDIVLPSGRVSRHHAEIVARRRGAHICDLRSTNGTRLNGEAVLQASPLRAGDRIAIADVEVIYQP